mgnify:CR=1 FL=1
MKKALFFILAVSLAMLIACGTIAYKSDGETGPPAPEMHPGHPGHEVH